MNIIKDRVKSLFETQIAEHEETTSASTKAIEEANKCASQLFPFTELDSDTARLVAKTSQKVDDLLKVLNQTSRGVLNAAELANVRKAATDCHLSKDLTDAIVLSVDYTCNSD